MITSLNKFIGNLVIWISNTRIVSYFEFGVFVYILKQSIKVRNQSELPRLFWGPIPILNNKYWSKAMEEMYFSKTVMNGFYETINDKSDFNLYVDDILKIYRFPTFLKERYRSFFLTHYAILNFDIFHIPFSGLFLSETKYWNKEADLYKRFNKKFVLLPYGADAYMYSRIKNESFQNALLTSYPKAAILEDKISEFFSYWSKKADFIPAGFMIDGFHRWDAVIGNFVIIDNPYYKSTKVYSRNDGKNGAVKIAHCPNHRGAKGTEFLIEAVKSLIVEGYNIELILFENVRNSIILERLHSDIDILVEQLILGYGLNAIEGMSSGVVTLSNLSIEQYTVLFRRYGSLNECPIVSVTPETIKDQLEKLIINPDK